jgi:hypothetical protein
MSFFQTRFAAFVGKFFTKKDQRFGWSFDFIFG